MGWKGVPAWCAIFAVAIAAPAAADPPLAGKRYDGGIGPRQPLFLRVKPDRGSLAGYAFGVRNSCSDGIRRLAAFASKGEGPANIASDGSFSYASPEEPSAFRLRNGKVARGKGTFKFSGRFVNGGQAVAGTVETSFSSSRLSCGSGPVPFTADADGTPNAPYRSTNVASGRYEVKGKRFPRSRLTAFLPGRLLARFSFRSIAKCHTLALRERKVVVGVPLQGPGFGIEAKETIRMKGGLRARERFKLAGGFFYNRAYRVRGAFRLTAVILRGRKRVDSCDTGKQTFAGTFRSGPADPAGPHPIRAP